jgi:hypothetical protein
MQKFELNFIVKKSLIRENSFAVLEKAKDIELEVTIGYKPEENYGFFEFYDVESGGEEWYAEGGLWFNGKELIDYDGCFELPDFIIDAFEEQGLDFSYAK